VATVSVTLSDNGGTANGGVDTSAVQTFTITVTNINDAPSFTKGADPTVNEDAGAQSVAGWATAISQGTGDSGQTLRFNITGNSNPSLLSAVAFAADGTLMFTPAANANGSTTITLTLSDDGGTANGGSDTSAAQTFVINVNAVNDAPSFTKGPDQVRDSASNATVTVAGWATAMSAGPADESGQTLSFTVTGNSAPALFSTAPAIASNGTLTYAPVAGASGISTITVVISDNGTTANGGVDTSAAQTFTIQFDVAPAVTTTIPANGATNVAPNSTISVNFSESVVASTSSFTINCGGSIGYTLSASPANSYTLTPASSLPIGTSCTVQVIASGIEDNDTFDPPGTMAANVSFSFTTSAP
jgi:large repetitive protein